DFLRLADELARALKLPGPGALRHVARDRDDVVAALLDQRLDRLVLLRHRRMPEMQVGAVEDRAQHQQAAWRLEPGDHGIGELVRAGGAAQIVRERLALTDRALERVAHTPCPLALA